MEWCSDRQIADWPELLHFYSRLKPGVTVFEWIKQYDTDTLGIDPRRFVSFGVIKVQESFVIHFNPRCR